MALFGAVWRIFATQKQAMAYAVAMAFLKVPCIPFVLEVRPPKRGESEMLRRRLAEIENYVFDENYVEIKKSGM